MSSMPADPSPPAGRKTILSLPPELLLEIIQATAEIDPTATYNLACSCKAFYNAYQLAPLDTAWIALETIIGLQYLMPAMMTALRVLGENQDPDDDLLWIKGVPVLECQRLAMEEYMDETGKALALDLGKKGIEVPKREGNRYSWSKMDSLEETTSEAELSSSPILIPDIRRIPAERRNDLTIDLIERSSKNLSLDIVRTALVMHRLVEKLSRFMRAAYGVLGTDEEGISARLGILATGELKHWINLHYLDFIDEEEVADRLAPYIAAAKNEQEMTEEEKEFLEEYRFKSIDELPSPLPESHHFLTAFIMKFFNSSEFDARYLIWFAQQDLTFPAGIDEESNENVESSSGKDENTQEGRDGQDSDKPSVDIEAPNHIEFWRAAYEHLFSIDGWYARGHILGAFSSSPTASWIRNLDWEKLSQRSIDERKRIRERIIAWDEGRLNTKIDVALQWIDMHKDRILKRILQNREEEGGEENWENEDGEVEEGGENEGTEEVRTD